MLQARAREWYEEGPFKLDWFNLKMSPFFVQALRRSGIESIPESKAFFLGGELPKHIKIDRTSFEGLKPEDLEIRYQASEIVPFGDFAYQKPLVRFDFTTEWNDLGYGAVRFGGEWGLAGAFNFTDGEKIAGVFERSSGRFVCDYVVRFRDGDRDALWINREVGLVDGYDWSIVEKFLGVPVVDEIPYGFDGAVTMRIDCDEAIASGRRMFELFESRGMPFSIAVKTQQPIGDVDRSFMSDLISSGGSVVGHSHTHAPNWGGGGEATVREVIESRNVLRSLGINGINLDYMVSPFHQNPVEAVRALAQAGVKGFVSGIICNDPEFLMARSGQVPLVEGIVSHSQQCMFHGDTLHADPTMSVYFRAWRQALETRTFFGFLDHPFSSYWYGWTSEEERLEAHARFLDVVAATPRTWRANLVDAMKFLDMRSRVRVHREGSSFVASLPEFEGSAELPSVAVRVGERSVQLAAGSEVEL